MMKLFKIEADQTEFGNLIRQVVKEALNEQKKCYNHKPEQKLLSRKEAADFLKVSLVTLHDWSNKDLIKPYKLGNRTYFKLEELLTSISKSNESE